MSEPHSPITELEPLEGIFTVLSDGHVTGTNKFGLLLALIDLAPTLPHDGRLDPDTLSLKLLEIHWPHNDLFTWNEQGTSRGIVLSQIREAKRRPTVLQEVERLHQVLEAQGKGAGSFHAALRRLPPTELSTSLARIKKDALRNPVARLQTISGQHIPFLYQVDSRKDIVLRPEALRALVVYGPLLREVVEFRFAQHVISKTPDLRSSALEAAIADHLFGLEKVMPSHALRDALIDLQHGRCLYSGQLISTGWSLDHVLPWIRRRESSLSNFVMTSASINSTKNEMLLAPAHLKTWASYVAGNVDELHELSISHSWHWAPVVNARSLRTFYSRSPNGLPLWSFEEKVVPLDDHARKSALGILDQLIDHVAA